MTRIYMIRHAEAEGNIYRLIHGQTDSLVTCNGKRQIRALENRFRDVPVDAVYASDLFRTCETAKALYLPKHLPLHRDRRFREVALGVWEGLPFGYLEHFERERMRTFSSDPVHWRIEGSEPYEVYTARFLEGLTEAAEANEGRTIAVFTHGLVSTGAMRQLFADALHSAGRCDNTGVTLLRYENDVFTPEFFYDNSHLDQRISTLAHQLWWRGKEDFNLWYRDPTAADQALFDPSFLPQEGHRVSIAMLKDRPAGYLCYHGNSLSYLYLLPEFRHRRMGDQLLGQAVYALRAAGLAQMQIGIPTHLTEALSFFTRHGAQITQMDDAYTVCRMAVAGPEPVTAEQ